ncbi:MAG TPA: type II secretion system protein [Thermoanaerobaculia bacterium]|nr:type II secretion system protein [Thermoanaerobaculia bacterium]
MHVQRGFSLIELLMALMILTVITTTSLAVFVERSVRQQQASELILAYQALANETEIVRRVDYDSLDSLTDILSSDMAIIQPLSPYSTEVDVALVRPGVKSVKITIRWRAHREASVTVLRTDTGGSNLW